MMRPRRRAVPGTSSARPARSGDAPSCFTDVQLEAHNLSAFMGMAGLRLSTNASVTRVSWETALTDCDCPTRPPSEPGRPASMCRRSTDTDDGNSLLGFSITAHPTVSCGTIACSALTIVDASILPRDAPLSTKNPVSGTGPFRERNRDYFKNLRPQQTHTHHSGRDPKAAHRGGRGCCRRRRRSYT